MLLPREGACQPPTGNPDLYGIGVRAGLYAQWGATLVATVFDPATESELRMANMIIQCSIFLGLCTESDNGGSAAGAVIIMLLLCGSLSSVTGDGISHLGRFSGMMRFTFYTGLSLYGCWFWFVGVDKMIPAGCDEFAFFGRTGFHGWFRVLGKVLSVLGAVACMVLDVLCAMALWKRMFKGDVVASFAKGPNVRPKVELALVILSTGLLVFSVVLIEYLIDINHFSGITNNQSSGPDTTGQLIPLIAGGLSVILVIWKVLFRGLLFRKRCWYIFGKHL